MIIAEGLLQNIEADEESFIEFYTNFSRYTLKLAQLTPVLSSSRIREAHGAWKKDLERVGDNENRLADGLDHFKRAGHMAFWLRRMSPIIDFEDQTVSIDPEYGYTLLDNEAMFRDLMEGHANEYVAFDAGFQFCKFYEKAVGSDRAQLIELDEDYIRTVCHYMKYKQVSPHALFMIYRSLFFKF